MKESTDASEPPSLPDRQLFWAEEKCMTSQSPELPPDRRAPPYERLRQAPWSAELTTEFGVNSTRAFVELMNEMRREEGRFPVPQGSYPTNARSLEKLVREMREIHARKAGGLKAAE